MKVLVALGVLGMLSVFNAREVAAPRGEFRLSGFSGTWLGKHSSQQTGECKGQGESAVVLDLDVSDDGAMEVRAGGAVLGVGTVSGGTWEVTLRNEKAFAVCGDERRTYERQYTGLFSKRGEELRLELEGEDAPCPPRCRFLDEYRVKKRDID